MQGGGGDGGEAGKERDHHSKYFSSIVRIARRGGGEFCTLHLWGEEDLLFSCSFLCVSIWIDISIGVVDGLDCIEERGCFGSVAERGRERGW